MPPLALTQAKYALAMFGMSVNEVPGWLVTMAPRAIGVPVAATPGLVPHADVLIADVLAGALALLAAVLVGVVVLEPEFEPLLLQPAAAMAMAAASTMVLRVLRVALGICALISPPLRWRVLLIDGHHDLDCVWWPVHGEFECLRRAGQREMMRKKRGERSAVGAHQVYGVAEILGGRAARADDLYFLLREDARPDRDGGRRHADHHDPAGRRDQVDGLRQDFWFAAGLDDQRRGVVACFAACFVGF